MTAPDDGDLLGVLLAGHAFDPVPRNSSLAELHVPFDELVVGTRVEATMSVALGRGQRVAIIGASGTGKSSTISYVLGPLVERLVPIPVSVSVEDPQIATDPIRFVRHVLDITAELIRRDFPARVRRLPVRRQKSTRTRTTSLSGGFNVKVLSAQVAREVQSIVENPRETTQQTVDQAAETVQVLRDEHLMPVIVLDDTDKWLQRPGTAPDVVARRNAFFTRVLRTIPEYLPCAVVVAVHPEYLRDPSWSDSRGFLGLDISTPIIATPAAIAHLLRHRAEFVADRQVAVAEIVTDAALQKLVEHYAADTPPTIRYGVLQVAQSALGLAHSASAAGLDAAHVAAAISQTENPRLPNV